MFQKIITLLVLLSIALSAKIINPYEKLETYTLNNGMHVILYSNENFSKTLINIKVGTGWKVEKWSNYGVAHLTEHLLFRSKEAKNNNYLEELQDLTNGYINATTTLRRTNFFAEINNEYVPKTLNIMSKIIYNRDNFTDFIDNEKKAVKIELGETSFSDYLLEFKTFIGDLPLKDPDIFNFRFSKKREESIPYDSLAKIKTKSLTQETIQTFLNDYYYPENMRLIIVGSFNKNKIKKIIEASFGENNNTGNKTTFREENTSLSLTGKPFYQESLGDAASGSISFEHILKDEKENIILLSFFRGLAKQIHRKIRGKDGESYTVRMVTHRDNKAVIYGILSDGETDKIDENNKKIEKTIFNKAKTITDKEIDKFLSEDKDNYFNAQNFSEPEAIKAFESYRYTSKEILHIQKTDLFENYQTITKEEYRSVLKKVIRPERMVKSKEVTHIFFPGDINVFLVLLIILFIWGTMKILNQAKVDPAAHIEDGETFLRIDIASPTRIAKNLVFSYFVGIIYSIGLLTIIDNYLIGLDNPWWQEYSIGIQLTMLLSVCLIIFIISRAIFLVTVSKVHYIILNQKEILFLYRKKTVTKKTSSLVDIRMEIRKGKPHYKYYYIFSFIDEVPLVVYHGFKSDKAVKELERMQKFTKSTITKI